MDHDERGRLRGLWARHCAHRRARWAMQPPSAYSRLPGERCRECREPCHSSTGGGRERCPMYSGPFPPPPPMQHSPPPPQSPETLQRTHDSAPPSCLQQCTSCPERRLCFRRSACTPAFAPTHRWARGGAAFSSPPQPQPPCVVRDANMGHQLAGGRSSWYPELESRTTHRITRSSIM